MEDDVEAVKTLCGMGFSRTQAVTALEEHGYDVQRALNSLLGQFLSQSERLDRHADRGAQVHHNLFETSELISLLLSWL